MVYPTLVSLDQALSHLQWPEATDGSPSPRDEDLLGKIEQATEIVLDYIVRPDLEATIEAWTAEDEGSPSTRAPRSVIAAILIQLGDLVSDRGDDPTLDRKRQPGDLHPAAAAYLRRWRNPVVS